MADFTGGSGPDVFPGTDQADTAYGNGGDDVLNGLGGDDTLDGGTGNDMLSGGADADRLTGGGGIDDLRGEGSDDTLVIAPGDLTPGDKFDGGAGYDTLEVAPTRVSTQEVNLAGYALTGIEAIRGSLDEGYLSPRTTISLAQADAMLGLTGLFDVVGSGTIDFGGTTFGAGTMISLGGPSTVDLRGATILDGGVVSVSGAWAEDFDDTMIGSEGADSLGGADGDDILEGRGGNDRLSAGYSGFDRYDGRDRLDGGEGDDVLEGGGLNGDTLIGGNGDDQILGSAGDDRIDGGWGADQLDGSSGDDVVDYSYLTAGITVTLPGSSDGSGADGDTLSSIEGLIGTAFNDVLTGTGTGDSVPASLARNYFDGGAGDDILTGLRGSDRLLGGDGNDRLDGGRENDSLEGGAGSDHLYGGDNTDSLFGGDGDDFLYGEAGNDSLSGGDGDDRLDSGEGDAGSLRGGAGNDYYILRGNPANITLVEAANEGIDTVETALGMTLGAGFENLILTGTANETAGGNALDNELVGNAGDNMLLGKEGDDLLYGKGGKDTLYGDAGNDLVDGGANDDKLYGGAGDDLYIVDGMGDQVFEYAGEGVDTVQSVRNFTLGANVENLRLVGTYAIDAIGNELANQLTGNDAANALLGNGGNDRLEGRGGNDTMIGGTGDDWYVVDAGDSVTEKAGEGTDTVESVRNTTLGANFENLVLAGTHAADGIGNELANSLTGNDAANALLGKDGADIVDGRGGNDHLDGGTGDDVLKGGGGADAIHGGLGADKLSGGNGSDGFWFETALGAGNIDTIGDFNVAADTIYLDRTIFSGIAANGELGAGAFRVGTAAVDADDRILYDAVTGNLWYDADGVGGVAAVQFARVDAGLAMTNADFVAVP